MTVKPESREQPTEETSGHTPGPWYWNRFRSTIQTRSPDSPSSEPNTVIALLFSGHGIEATPGNVRLIAAAPDLLEACKRAMPSWIPAENDADGHICCELTNGDVRALLAAVAKAVIDPNFLPPSKNMMSRWIGRK